MSDRSRFQGSRGDTGLNRPDGLAGWRWFGWYDLPEVYLEYSGARNSIWSSWSGTILLCVRNLFQSEIIPAPGNSAVRVAFDLLPPPRLKGYAGFVRAG